MLRGVQAQAKAEKEAAEARAREEARAKAEEARVKAEELARCLFLAVLAVPFPCCARLACCLRKCKARTEFWGPRLRLVGGEARRRALLHKARRDQGPLVPLTAGKGGGRWALGGHLPAGQRSRGAEEPARLEAGNT